MLFDYLHYWYLSFYWRISTSDTYLNQSPKTMKTSEQMS